MRAGNFSTGTIMDWDKLKVFHAAAQAGSFTHAGEQLGLSQSAVSRQVSALEQELGVSLFHRHARGLILTEQGELLQRTAHDVFMKLEAARTKLTDSRERPNGELKVTTTVGIGVHWLTPAAGRVPRSLSRNPDHADHHRRRARPRHARGRRRHPAAPADAARSDPAQAVLAAFHACASPEYLKRFGTPRSVEELDQHRTIILGGTIQPWLQQSGNWLLTTGRPERDPRLPWLTINNVLGVLRACQRGIGIAMLPDYLVEENGGLVHLFGDNNEVAYDAYFVYPEELKSVARVQVFRDFLVAKAQRWHF